jgi:hypothetical protein
VYYLTPGEQERNHTITFQGLLKSEESAFRPSLIPWAIAEQENMADVGLLLLFTYTIPGDCLRLPVDGSESHHVKLVLL